MQFNRKQATLDDRRFRIVSLAFLFLALWIVVRLFMLQIVNHTYYALFALNSHEMYQQLHPERGQIYFKDIRNNQEYPAAINKVFYQIYAVPK